MPRLLKVLPAIALLNLLALSRADAAEPFLRDEFEGPSVDASLWHIPTGRASGDGTFVGRTQFRVTQDSPLPAIADGSIVIPIETYNPREDSFLGTELITNREFPLGDGLDVIVRAKMATPLRPGVVGGIFLYAMEAKNPELHDELDFELLTNRPDRVQTNIYGNEPLGVGHVKFIPYRSGSMTDFHLYEMRWRPGQVSWLIDGKLVRTTKSHLLSRPVSFHLNAWAPDANWPNGFNAAIQPTRSQAANTVVGSLIVDSVIIRPSAP
ncbi:MAG TPA: glycoside hydrolase family 16 protein [Alphaproteobacteria bacterium]|nr:glycoside hydrolase family 16 protein [Alphaproteobacteria bacterium]